MLHGDQIKYCFPCSMGTQITLLATPLQRERESKKPVVVFFCWHKGHFGHSGCRGVEKVSLHHLIPINGVNDMNFAQPKLSMTSEEMVAIADKIRNAIG